MSTIVTYQLAFNFALKCLKYKVIVTFRAL